MRFWVSLLCAPLFGLFGSFCGGGEACVCIDPSFRMKSISFITPPSPKIIMWSIPLNLSWAMQHSGRFWWVQVRANKHKSLQNVIPWRYWLSSFEQSYVGLVLRQPQNIFSWRTFQQREFQNLTIPKARWCSTLADTDHK